MDEFLPVDRHTGKFPPGEEEAHLICPKCSHRGDQLDAVVDGVFALTCEECGYTEKAKPFDISLEALRQNEGG